MTTDMIRHYSLLVEFLGKTMGPYYEIALHDLGHKQASIVAIANGHVSGRSVGAPLTNLSMQLLAEKSYETQDWKLNYRGISVNGKILRCSTLFIKDERGIPTGLLCINFDDSHYRELSEKVFFLCHPDDYATRNISISAIPLSPDSVENNEQEVLYPSIFDATEAALLSVMNSAEIPADRLTQAERVKIIRLLDQKGIFMLKGAIPVVAKRLACSQASIYRYLSSIKQKKQDTSPAEE